MEKSKVYEALNYAVFLSLLLRPAAYVQISVSVSCFELHLQTNDSHRNDMQAYI
jgi:hypothetical protein